MFSFIRRHRRAFTVLELLISAVLLGVVAYAAWDSYSSGTRSTEASGDYLSAMQGATILMEMMQEDIRQTAVLNEPGCGLIPFTINFSKHGKSVMFRKSSLTNTSGEMQGSSFTAVAYQLVEHPTEKDCYTVRRVETTTDGKPLPALGSVEDERLVKSLLVKDVRYDLMVKFEQNVRYRTFVRVSITATNLGAQKNEPRVYMMSNVFEATSPEFIHNKTGQTGFARRFLLSNIQPDMVMPGQGFHEKLPPVAWVEFFNKTEWDYLDKNGQMKDFPDPPGASATLDVFETASFSAPPLRQRYIQTAVNWFKSQVGDTYRGRILVQVNSYPTNPTPWTYGFSLDASKSATKKLTEQLNEELSKMITAHDYEGVEQMGHAIGAQLQSGSVMISDDQAKKIVQGQ